MHVTLTPSISVLTSFSPSLTSLYLYHILPTATKATDAAIGTLFQGRPGTQDPGIHGPWNPLPQSVPATDTSPQH